ncbi:MAG: hypothetical protein M1825_006384 [Sarcosagium campestre]|nr:MAG: hypothetical protein M1825_006384 [Sarcosagium campestre]
MADKEATVYIIDVGSSMGQRHEGRTETDLEWALQYFWDKITSTVATGRKTFTVGVLGLRTDGTQNHLGEDPENENISEFQPISQILLPQLHELKSKIKPSKTESGDAISALVIAISMIDKYCRTLKYRRKITMITNGRGTMQDDEIDSIVSKMKHDSIELTVLGVDFDDLDYGFKEDNKDASKRKGEALLKSITEACDGVFGTMKQAISELDTPRIKVVKPIPSYKGQLSLGDAQKYSSAMCVDVERYPKTMIAKAPSATSFVSRKEPETVESSIASSVTMGFEGSLVETGLGGGGQDLTAVRSNRIYTVEDAAAPGMKRNVDREELAKGYEYGRTAVHISQSDENVTTLETKANLDIVGFVPRDKYDRFMHMSTANVIVPQKANDKAGMALSSIAHALFELDSYAVARLVTKNDKPPIMLLLAPHIEYEYECLLEVQLPFAEDVRSYQFPPLDKVVTVSGKTLKEHRNLPSAELTNAMSDYVDAMDLSKFGDSENDGAAEFLLIEDSYSPLLHRIDQAVRLRAVHPTENLPAAYEILTSHARPPAELVQKSQGRFEALKEAAAVKKVPPKQRGHKRKQGQDKPLSGLDVDGLLGRQKRGKISAENAVPEFKQMLRTTSDADGIKDAAGQMANIVSSRIKGSFGDSGYARAIEELRTMREELEILEEPELWNKLVRDLKGKLERGQLGGDRTEMWWLIRKNRLGLMDVSTMPHSDASVEDAAAFLRAN